MMIMESMPMIKEEPKERTSDEMKIDKATGISQAPMYKNDWCNPTIRKSVMMRESGRMKE